MSGSDASGGSDSDSVQAKLPNGVKAEISAEYRNQPINSKTGESKLKQFKAELETSKTGLVDSLESIADAATDVAETLPRFDGDFDENDMPADSVGPILPTGRVQHDA